MNRRNHNNKSRDNFKCPKFIILNKDIGQCCNLGDLLDIYVDYRNGFNEVNLVTLIFKIAKLSKQRDQFDFRLWNQDKDYFIKSFYNESMKKISQFNSQALANTIWALATLKVNHFPLITLIANESMKKISQFNSQDLANAIWALATLKVNHSPLITLIANASMKEISQFNSQALANTIWALATLKVNHSPLITLIANESMKKISQFNSQALANTIWALATLNSYHSELFCKISSLAITHLADFKETQIRQIYYVYLVAKYIWKIDDIDDLLPLNVICLYYNAKKIEVNPSRLQEEVFQVISQQVNCQFEFITEELLSLDIAIEEKKIAIEVNGPSHYLSDKSLDGSSDLKCRLLQHLGWEVIVIPYFDWDSLSPINKTNFINDLLDSSVC